MLGSRPGHAYGTVSAMEKSPDGRFTKLRIQTPLGKTMFLRVIFWMHEDPITMDPQHIKILPDQLKQGQLVHITYNNADQLLSIEPMPMPRRIFPAA